MTEERKRELIPHIEALYQNSHWVKNSWAQEGIYAIIRFGRVTFNFSAKRRGVQAAYKLTFGKVWTFWHDKEWKQVRSYEELKAMAEAEFESKIEAIQQKCQEARS